MNILFLLPLLSFALLVDPPKNNIYLEHSGNSIKQLTVLSSEFLFNQMKLTPFKPVLEGYLVAVSSVTEQKITNGAGLATAFGKIDDNTIFTIKLPGAVLEGELDVKVN